MGATVRLRPYTWSEWAMFLWMSLLCVQCVVSIDIHINWHRTARLRSSVRDSMAPVDIDMTEDSNNENMGSAASFVTYSPSKECEGELDAYCRGHVQDGWGVTSLARHLEGTGPDTGSLWRCFDPDGLTMNGLRYDSQKGLANYVTMDKELKEVLNACMAKRGEGSTTALAHGCDRHLNQLCRDTLKDKSWGEYALARFLQGDTGKGDSMLQWRCFEPRALTSDTLSYDVESKGSYVTMNEELEKMASTPACIKPSNATNIMPGNIVAASPVALRTKRGKGMSAAPELSETPGGTAVHAAIVSRSYEPAGSCGPTLDQYCQQSVTEPWGPTSVARLSIGSVENGDTSMAWRCFNPFALNSTDMVTYDVTRDTKEYVSFSEELLDKLAECQLNVTSVVVSPLVHNTTEVPNPPQHPSVTLEAEVSQLKEEVKELKERQSEQRSQIKSLTPPKNAIPVVDVYGEAKGCDAALNGLCREVLSYRSWGSIALARKLPGSPKLNDEGRSLWRCYAPTALTSDFNAYDKGKGSTDYDTMDLGLTSALNKCMADRADNQAKFPPSRGCDVVLSKWCRGSVTYGWGSLAVARLLPASGEDSATSEWRCYAPSALTADTMEYDVKMGSTAYATEHTNLLKVLSDCESGIVTPTTISETTKPLSEYNDAKNCDQQLNGFCAARVQAGWAPIALARNLPGNAASNDASPRWRCYSPDALTADTLSYDATKASMEYFTLHDDIEEELERCLGDRGDTVVYKPAEGCDHRLNMWCRTNVKSEWGEVSLARLSTGSSGHSFEEGQAEMWRCYSPATLTADTMKYDEVEDSDKYWSNHEELEKQLKKCVASRKFGSGKSSAAPVTPTEGHQDSISSGGLANSLPGTYQVLSTLRSQTRQGPYLYDGGCIQPRATSQHVGPSEQWMFVNAKGSTMPEGSVNITTGDKLYIKSSAFNKYLNFNGGCSDIPGVDTEFIWSPVDAKSGLVQLVDSSGGQYLAVNDEGNLYLSSTPFTWYVTEYVPPPQESSTNPIPG